MGHDTSTTDNVHDSGKDVALLYETYHLNSGIERCHTGFFQRIMAVNNSSLGFELSGQASKRYACADRVPLPLDIDAPDLPVRDAISRRMSSQAFRGGELSVATLSLILRFANGQSGSRRPGNLPRRSVPSGGALYPCEVYLLPFEVTSLDPGAYHYDVIDHDLARFHRRPSEDLVARACFNDFAVVGASAALVITACFERQSFKYGERAYRFALIEAGHIAQNILLVVELLGLAALPIGGFVDREINDFLEIDGISEAALYVLLIGNKL